MPRNSLAIANSLSFLMDHKCVRQVWPIASETFHENRAAFPKLVTNFLTGISVAFVFSDGTFHV